MKLFFWKDWDEADKAKAVKTIGLLVAFLAVFSLVACVSYLFHWKEDMSLIGTGGPDAANINGSSGNRLGAFLIKDCFGLGSFALIFIVGIVALRLLIHAWSRSISKTIIISLTGAFLVGVALSYLGNLLGLGSLFGAGLGGRCGWVVCDWSLGVLGAAGTPAAIATLILIWFILSGDRFGQFLDKCRKLKEQRKAAKEEERLRREAEEAELKALRAQEEELLVEAAEDEAEETDLQETAAPSVPGTPSEDADANVEGVPVVIMDGDELDSESSKPLKPIDNRLDPPEGLPHFKSPQLSLLESYSDDKREVTTEELMRNNNKIRVALGNYRIKVDDVKAQPGPTVTLYKVYPSAGVKISDIKNRQEDIAMFLGAKGVRVVSLCDCVGIEVANDHSSIVPLKALLNDPAFRESKAELPVAIGYTITQKIKVFDLADAPHLLIAGATKQGKSVGLNVIVSSLLYSKHPSELKFVFIDPKMVEFPAYGNLLKHYLAVLPQDDERDEKENSIVKKPKDAERILLSLCIEMDQRYELLSKAGVNNLGLYNNKYKERKLNPQDGHRFLPYLVVVVDEYADLTMTAGAAADSKNSSRNITTSIIRLAQKGRAAGIHVILATQRPSVNVISGLIKSNFPMRIAFRVAARVDSVTILDSPGAEKLIGRGDMLFSAGIDTERIQCAYISGDETRAITDFIGSQTGYGKSYSTPYYLPLPEEESAGSGGSLNINDLDERFEEAARMVVSTQRGSTSDIQRRLGMGYAKAGRVMDQLESAGIVGPQEGSKPRQVLITDLDALEELLSSLR